MSDIDTELGPVDYVVVAFPAGQAKFSGEMASELRALMDSNTVRVLDLVLLTKDADGSVEASELRDADDALDELRSEPPGRGRHRAGAPVSCIGWLFLRGFLNHFSNLGVGDGPRSTGAPRVFPERLNPAIHVTVAPPRRLLRRNSKFRCNLLILQPGSGTQHDPRSFHQARGQRTSARQLRMASTMAASPTVTTSSTWVRSSSKLRTPIDARNPSAVPLGESIFALWWVSTISSK